MHETEVWKPFQKEVYQWAWHKQKLFGIFKELGRDLRYCYQRIWHGYCDQDLFSIDSWFLSIMPSMLEDFRDNSHSCPITPGKHSHQVSDTDDTDTEAMREWISVLNRMIFLMREADERTCTRSNPYEEEFLRARQEFENKFGLFGEKLTNETESESLNICHGKQLHFLWDLDEYQVLSNNYLEEARKIDRYRSDCKDEALALFSKWFYDLWD